MAAPLVERGDSAAVPATPTTAAAPDAAAAPTAAAAPAAKSQAADTQLLRRLGTLAACLSPHGGAHQGPASTVLLDGAAQTWLDRPRSSAPWPQRLRARLTFGAGAWRDAVRMALCLAVAVIVGGVLHADHGFWVPLMVAIIMKPDFGSVFARALQRTAGTMIGAAIGIGLAIVLPTTGPWVPIALILLALPMPWAAMRAYWLLSVFITPVVILLVEWAVGSGGAQLGWFRLLDTVIAGLIVIVIGYAVWPQSYRTNVPGVFADALSRICAYLEAVFTPTRTPADAGAVATARDTAYRRLSDLHIQLQRTLAEPPPASRTAQAWYPAVAAASRLADLITAYDDARVRAMTAGSSDSGFAVPTAAAVTARVQLLADLSRHSAFGHRAAAATTPMPAAAGGETALSSDQPPADPSGAFADVDEELDRLARVVQARGTQPARHHRGLRSRHPSPSSGADERAAGATAHTE